MRIRVTATFSTTVEDDTVNGAVARVADGLKDAIREGAIHDVQISGKTVPDRTFLDDIVDTKRKGTE